MKCPMLKKRSIIAQLSENPKTLEVEVAEFQECIGEECAWWVDNAQCCSIRCNAESLGQVALTAISLRKEEVE